jgi:hypothetical protein
MSKEWIDFAVAVAQARERVLREEANQWWTRWERGLTDHRVWMDYAVAVAEYTRDGLGAELHLSKPRPNPNTPPHLPPKERENEHAEV